MEKKFTWSSNPEPHDYRRKKIIEAHPEIKKLMGYDYRSKYICILLVASQTFLALIVPNLDWFRYIIVSYVIGATLTQALFLAIHELSHNLFFQNCNYNRYFSLFVNGPIVVPFSIAFKEYHIQHHKFQGTDGVDTDIPSSFEVKLFQGPILKVIWLSFQIVAYAIRPLAVKSISITRFYILNFITQAMFNIILYHYGGIRSFYYLVVCILMAGGIHPCAGHFISEHYQPYKGCTQETFSYYGILNNLTWNVGYHNEHHDFPYIPGSRLPKLNNIANEFYDNLEVCDSWTKIFYKYIFYEYMGPHCRIKRKLLNKN